MANYSPIRPLKDQVVNIPVVNKRTMIQAIGGEMLVSSDEIFDADRCIVLNHGSAHEIPAGGQWKCACYRGQGAELRRMDLE